MSYQKNTTRKLLFTGLCVGVNIISSFLALTLRLPVYLDTVGTIMVANLFGAPWAVLCALLSSICNAAYDPFALPFAPQGMTTALAASLILRWQPLKHLPRVVQGLLIAIPAALVGAVIAGYVFSGVTSSGSSYFVQLLHFGLGLPIVGASFIVQFFTDAADKIIIVFLVKWAVSRMPEQLKEKLIDI